MYCLLVLCVVYKRIEVKNSFRSQKVGMQNLDIVALKLPKCLFIIIAWNSFMLRLSPITISLEG